MLLCAGFEKGEIFFNWDVLHRVNNKGLRFLPALDNSAV